MTIFGTMIGLLNVIVRFPDGVISDTKAARVSVSLKVFTGFFGGFHRSKKSNSNSPSSSSESPSSLDIGRSRSSSDSSDSYALSYSPIVKIVE